MWWGQQFPLSICLSIHLHEFPTENYIRHHAPHFIVSGTTLRHEQMFHWLNFLLLKSGHNIQDKRNTGSVVWIGKYFVYSFCAKTCKVYEYNGCYWHENDCTKCKKADTQLRRDCKKRTLECKAHIEQQGYPIISITDHEFEQWCLCDPELNQFVHARTLQGQSPFQTIYRGCHIGRISPRQAVLFCRGGYTCPSK